MVFQLVKKFSFLDVTAVLLVYMDKLVYINSDRNHEVISKQWILGSNYGEHLEIGHNCEKYSVMTLPRK